MESNVQNELTSKIVTNSQIERRLTAVWGGGECWRGRRGFKQKKRKREKTQGHSPSCVAQLVNVPLIYTRAVGLIPSQGTYKNEPMNASISGTTNQ